MTFEFSERVLPEVSEEFSANDRAVSPPSLGRRVEKNKAPLIDILFVSFFFFFFYFLPSPPVINRM